MSNRTHDQIWLEKHALFGCCSDGCAEEHSYPADDLALNIEGEPICEACWEWNMKEGDPLWSELRRFNPFEVK